MHYSRYLSEETLFKLRLIDIALGKIEVNTMSREFTQEQIEANEMAWEEENAEQSIKQMEFFEWFESTKNTSEGFLEAYDRAEKAGITVTNFINYELNKRIALEANLSADDIPF